MGIINADFQGDTYMEFEQVIYISMLSEERSYKHVTEHTIG